MKKGIAVIMAGGAPQIEGKGKPEPEETDMGMEETGEHEDTFKCPKCGATLKVSGEEDES